MIIVDTNVVSAWIAAGGRQDAAIVQWFDEQDDRGFGLTTVSIFELRFGIERLPAGRRKSHLAASLQTVLVELFEGRFIPFDAPAAGAAAVLQAEREARGQMVELADAQIAGIAISRRASICTRNVRHFEDAGVPVLNPWA